MEHDSGVRAGGAQDGYEDGASRRIARGGSTQGLENAEIKNYNFIELLQTQALRNRDENGEPPFKRQRPTRDPPVNYTWRGDGKGKGKGKGKGIKGEQKGYPSKAHNSGCANRTPNDEPICFKFNNAQEKCFNKSCKFAQVCGKCFKKGVPMYECSHNS